MQRRLAAILAADAVGYTRLMNKDEAGTLAAATPVTTAPMATIVIEAVALQHITFPILPIQGLRSQKRWFRNVRIKRGYVNRLLRLAAQADGSRG